jgi:hypothetical protein
MTHQGRDRLATASTGDHEQWCHKLRGIETSLTHEGAHSGIRTKPSRPLAGGGVDIRGG